jgi:N utilization substance protein A
MFRQNLLNELKGLEREEAFEFFNDKVGEIVSARVLSKNDKFITFSLGKGIDATMSYRDALPNEEFLVGEEKKVYLSKVEKTTKGPKVFISRSNKEIVKKLFEMYIPEISSGLIEIMGISREPGSRTKIGVLSVNGDIDPKGACVGNGGSRIKAINEILNGEKIDIFVWKNNPIDLIAEALSPAKVVSVMPDEKEKRALVIANDDQFSLAIGRNGQNAKLAAFATGWKIDIKKLSEAYTEGIDFRYNVNC